MTLVDKVISSAVSMMLAIIAGYAVATTPGETGFSLLLFVFPFCILWFTVSLWSMFYFIGRCISELGDVK